MRIQAAHTALAAFFAFKIFDFNKVSMRSQAAQAARAACAFKSIGLDCHPKGDHARAKPLIMRFAHA